MTISEPRLRALLRQAERVAENGKFAAAESLYQQILDEAPQSEAAWLGLAQVATDPAKRREAYEQVLTLNPANEEAAAAVGQADDEAVVQGGIEESLAASRAFLDDATGSKSGSDGLASVSRAPLAKAPAGALPKPEAGVQERTQHVQSAEAEADVELFCYRHPDRSTALRCYKCSRPICSACTVKTPVGYLCPECQREAENTFFNSRPLDYVLAALVALPLSLLAGYLVWRLGSGFFVILIMLFAGGAVGGVIGRLVKRVIGRRRGRYIPHLVAASVILGVVLPGLPVLLAILFGNAGALFALLGPGIYLFTATGSAFYWSR